MSIDLASRNMQQILTSGYLQKREQTSNTLNPLPYNESIMNAQRNNNSVMTFSNQLKNQEKKDTDHNVLDNYYKADLNTEQQKQNAYVFDITHSFAKDNLNTQTNQTIQNQEISSPLKGYTASSCSSIQQFTQRANTLNQNQQLCPSKNNSSIANQNLIIGQQNLISGNQNQIIGNQNMASGNQYLTGASCSTNQNNPLNTFQSLNIGSQTKLAYEELAKSPKKNSLLTQQGKQQQINGYDQQQELFKQQNIQQLNGQSIVQQVIQNHMNNTQIINKEDVINSSESKSMFFPNNQFLANNSSNQDGFQSSISQNNSSILCNTNSKSTYRSNSVQFNLNNQSNNYNVRNLLSNNQNNTNFDFSSISNTTNIYNANNNSIHNNHIQNTNDSNPSNHTHLLTNENTKESINLVFNQSKYIERTKDENLQQKQPQQQYYQQQYQEYNQQQLQQNSNNINNNINKSILNVSNCNNMSSNNVSFVGNCNNNTIVKALEKNMDESQKHVQHLINTSQQLQNNYNLEAERYIEQLNDLREKQDKCESKQRKKKQELLEVEQIIQKHETKQEYDTLMILSNEENRRKCIEETFNNHQQLDTVLCKIKNLISVIPDAKMHDKFFSSTQPLESALKQISVNKRDLIMHILREKDQQNHINECMSALREDFNSYIMQNTEYTLQYEECNEILDSLKAQYPSETEYLCRKTELASQKEFLFHQLQDKKQKHEYIQNEIQYKEQQLAKLQENSQLLSQRLEQARRNKQSAPDYQSYENQFQLFLAESFDESARQYYKNFICIFDAEFLQSSISHTQENTNQLITKIISFQTLLLQETQLLLSNSTHLISDDLRKIQDQKRELMVDLNQISMLKEIVLSILSFDQLLLNVSMCVRNMKRKDVIMQTFYQYLMSKQTQFTFRFQAQNDIQSITEDYMRTNRDILTIEGDKKGLQSSISEVLRDIAQLKNQFTSISADIETNEQKFKIHFANECTSYYKQYLLEKNIVIKDISFNYGKSYVEKLEEDIKEQFDKANACHLEKINEQITSLTQSMFRITDKRQYNFRIIEDEIKPSHEEYKRQQKEGENKAECLSTELADIIGKEKIYINQLNTILSEQFDLKNKKFQKGSALYNLQELMQQSEDESLSNYNQTLQLMLEQTNQKQQRQEISLFSKLQLLREKINVIQEELHRMTANDMEVIRHIENQLRQSESAMKEYHSKIEQIQSVLKDQLVKMNLDSETIFNTFNLNFSSQVLNVKDLINRDEDKMKIITNRTNNSVTQSKSGDTNTKRSRNSKSMYINTPQQQQNNLIYSQMQKNAVNNINYPIPQPKYGKITIDINSLNNITDSNHNLQNSQQSLIASSYSFNMNKENQQPTNNVNKFINQQLPQSKQTSSSKYDMAKQLSSLSINNSETFFNSTSSKASKSNQFVNSGRSQSQIFLNGKPNNGLSSQRSPSTILSDPLYNELTNGISTSNQIYQNFLATVFSNFITFSSAALSSSYHIRISTSEWLVSIQSMKIKFQIVFFEKINFLKYYLSNFNFFFIKI